MDNFKSDFLNVGIFLHPQIPDFKIISTKYCPILTNIHYWNAYLFSFQMMYKSQLKKKKYP